MPITPSNPKISKIRNDIYCQHLDYNTNHFKINFPLSYHANQSYPNTFMFMKCISVQNEFSPIISSANVSLANTFMLIKRHSLQILFSSVIPCQLVVPYYHANTFTFIKCQSVQNQFPPVIPCQWVLRQYLHVYQVLISSKSIFSHHTMPTGHTPIPSCLSSVNQFKINFLPSYNTNVLHANTFTFIKCQSVQNQFAPIIPCQQIICQYLHVYQAPNSSKSIFSHHTTPMGHT